MEQLFKQFLNKYEIKNQSVVVAVSTGIDSMVLLDLLMKAKDEYNLDIIVAHVNHKKRSQSEIEEKYIKDFCNNNNLKIEVSHLDLEIHANFQSEARKFRYHFFIEVLEKHSAKVLFTAHHGSDNVETFFIKLLRQSPIKSFDLIKEKSLLKNKYDVYRPLLNVSKDDIINYQVNNNILYYEDESNSTSDYLRNKIRHNLIKPLEEIDENYITKIDSFRNKISKLINLANNITDKFIKDNITYTKYGFSFNKNDFLDLESYTQEDVIFTLNKTIELKNNQVSEIIKIISSNKANISTIINEVPFLKVIKNYDIISFENSTYDNKYDNECIIDGSGDYLINDTISINVAKKVLSTIPNYNQLCYNMNYFPLKVRTRQNGDKVFIGSGYKKVKDILIDKKIPLSLRDDVLVVLNNQDEIIWIVGVYKSPITKSSQFDCVITVNKNKNN